VVSRCPAAIKVTERWRRERRPLAGAFTFTANSTNGGTVVATLVLAGWRGKLGNGFLSTSTCPWFKHFWNTNPIYIPALQYVPFPDVGPASPYPSSIQVSNVTGYVSKVTVTVSNMSHTYPHDIGLLLVGPGTNTVLMDAAAQGFQDMIDTTLTFDSTAANVLPGTGNLTSGTYQPARLQHERCLYQRGNSQPRYQRRCSSLRRSSLTNFNGLSPNGVWSLVCP
jgi:hypothetical protein